MSGIAIFFSIVSGFVIAVFIAWRMYENFLKKEFAGIFPLNLKSSNEEIVSATEKIVEYCVDVGRRACRPKVQRWLGIEEKDRFHGFMINRIICYSGIPFSFFGFSIWPIISGFEVPGQKERKFGFPKLKHLSAKEDTRAYEMVLYKIERELVTQFSALGFETCRKRGEYDIFGVNDTSIKDEPGGGCRDSSFA